MDLVERAAAVLAGMQNGDENAMMQCCMSVSEIL